MFLATHMSPDDRCVFRSGDRGLLQHVQVPRESDSLLAIHAPLVQLLSTKPWKSYPSGANWEVAGRSSTCWRGQASRARPLQCSNQDTRHYDHGCLPVAKICCNQICKESSWTSGFLPALKIVGDSCDAGPFFLGSGRLHHISHWTQDAFYWENTGIFGSWWPGCMFFQDQRWGPRLTSHESRNTCKGLARTWNAPIPHVIGSLEVATCRKLVAHLAENLDHPWLPGINFHTHKRSRQETLMDVLPAVVVDPLFSCRNWIGWMLYLLRRFQCHWLMAWTC